jgi:diguanylate cyclase (GGDEF)-like protein
MDIDQFKAINDSCGHAAGDEVLKLLTRTTLRQLRAQDRVARLGGDEFCLLLPETSGAQAKAVAQRLVNEFRDKTTFYEGRTIMATISVGVAEWSPEVGHNALGLIAQADRALYQTKQRGRDGVTLEGGVVSGAEPDVLAA